MSEATCCGCNPKRMAWCVGILGTCLLTYGLTQVMRHYTSVPDLTAARATERARNLEEIRAGEAAALSGYAWQNKERGFVRVPLDRALELSLAEYQDPRALRERLVTRVRKLNEAPPKAPEKPSAFE